METDQTSLRTGETDELALLRKEERCRCERRSEEPAATRQPTARRACHPPPFHVYFSVPASASASASARPRPSAACTVTRVLQLCGARTVRTLDTPRNSGPAYSTVQSSSRATRQGHRQHYSLIYSAPLSQRSRPSSAVPSSPPLAPQLRASRAVIGGDCMQQCCQ